jgi:hypothetical protein
MTKAWMFTKKNLDIVLTIIGAVIVAALGLFSVVKPDIVSAAILMILSLLAISLLRNRVTDGYVQHTMEKMLERQQKPTVEQVIGAYKDFLQDIEGRLAAAREVWVLSRTCAHLWQDFNDQFMKLLSNNGYQLRMMLVDPKDGALRMIAGSAEGWDNPNNVRVWRANLKHFLEQLANLCVRPMPGLLQVRTIDYLPAWTLIFVAPSSDRGVIYVELATFRANPRNRPAFCLMADRDARLFQAFKVDFETMWERARSITTDSTARELLNNG